MSEWKEFEMAKVASFSYGKMPKKDLLNTGVYPTYSGYKYQYLYPEYNCEAGDLIVVARGVGGTGDVKIVTEKCYLTNLSIKIEFNKDTIDNLFFYYFTKIETLRYLDSGSAQSQITIQDLQKESFKFPELSNQKAIASVFSSLDDKIDLLHRQNQTLEQMAETLFRQWFVERCPEPVEGEADEGWEIGILGDEFDFTMGQSPPGSSFNEEGLGTPMYQGNRDFGFRFPENRVFTTEPKSFAEKFDTLVSVRAPVGEQNMANEKCCIGRGVAAFRYKANPNYYTYTFFKMKSLIDEIKQFNETGTVFGSISKSDFQEMEVSIPPLNEVEKFHKEVKPIDDKIITNCNQIRTLTALRDTLLPKLMSGEVRVEMDATAKMEEA